MMFQVNVVFCIVFFIDIGVILELIVERFIKFRIGCGLEVFVFIESMYVIVFCVQILSEVFRFWVLDNFV